MLSTYQFAWFSRVFGCIGLTGIVPGENTFVWILCFLTWVHVLGVQLEQVYAEVYRVLKPGAYFAVYEVVTKPNFDPKNKRHVELINNVVYGNGIPVAHPSASLLALI
jgi:hypothetical protein